MSKQNDMTSSWSDAQNNLSSRDARSSVNPQDVNFEDNGPINNSNKNPTAGAPVTLTSDNFPLLVKGSKNQQKRKNQQNKKKQTTTSKTSPRHATQNGTQNADLPPKSQTNEPLEQQLKQLQEKLEEQQKEFDQKEQELKSKLTSLESQNATLQEQLQTKQTEISKLTSQLQDEKKSSAEKLEKAQKEITGKDNELKAQLSKVQHLEQQHKQAAEQLPDSDQDKLKIKELEDKIHTLTTQHNESTKNIKQLETSYAASVQKYESQIKTLEQEKQQLLSEGKNAKSGTESHKLQDLTTQNEQLNKKIKDLDALNQKQKTELQTAKINCEASAKQLRAAQEKLTAIETEKAQLEKQLSQKHQDYLLETIRRAGQTKAISDKPHAAPAQTFRYSAFALTTLQTIANTK